MSEIFWCRNCQVPIMKRTCGNCHHRGTKICSDLRPVFPDEAKLIERETGIRLAAHGWQEGLWERQNTLWWNGRRLLRLNRSIDTIKIEKVFPRVRALNRVKKVNSKIIYKANKIKIKSLEREARRFIRRVVTRNPTKLPIVSFSGGKDSSVTSYLVRGALRNHRVLHVFGDTTIEYPDTYEYIDRFSKDNPDVPFYSRRSRNDFFSMCEQLGPPSRLNAWCCSVFKSSPIAGLMNNINGWSGVISFEGIRRAESRKRRNRERLYENKKIVHQLSAYPILEWKEIHVWLFLLTKGLAFNTAYLRGLDRVGCLYCPNNRPRNEMILWDTYPVKMSKFRDLIQTYAKRIGKNDPSEYYTSGAWKIRVGKMDGKSPVYVRKARCLSNQNAMHFILDVPIDDSFVERFKPFGTLVRFSDDRGDGFVVVDKNTGASIFSLRRVGNVELLRKESEIDPTWELGSEFLCVDILVEKNKKRLLDSIERQVRKYQACVSCEACAGVCPTGAITVNPHFRVSEEKCVHCGNCLSVKFVKAGCVSINSQQQGRGFLGDNRV